MTKKAFIRRLTAFTLALFMILSIITAISFADNEPEYQIKYVYKDGDDYIIEDKVSSEGTLVDVIVFSVNTNAYDADATIISELPKNIDYSTVNLILSNVIFTPNSEVKVKSLTTLSDAQMLLKSGLCFKAGNTIYFGNDNNTVGKLALDNNSYAQITNNYSDSAKKALANKTKIKETTKASEFIELVNSDNIYAFDIKGGISTTLSSPCNIDAHFSIKLNGTLTVLKDTTLNINGSIETTETTKIVNNGTICFNSDFAIRAGATVENNNELYIGSNSISVKATIAGDLINNDGGTLYLKGYFGSGKSTKVDLKAATLVNNGKLSIDTRGLDTTDYTTDNAVITSNDDYSAIKNGESAEIIGKSIFFKTVECMAVDRTSEIKSTEYYCKEGNKWGACEHDYKKVSTVGLATYSHGAKDLMSCSKCNHKEYIESEPLDITEKYTDLVSGAWYISHVSLAVDNSLFKGVSDNSFAPDATMTRAEFVTVLAAISGDDLASFKAQSYASFSDVPTDSWAFPYVEWAKSVGVAKGTSEDTFGAQDKITNEQACVMVFAFLKAKNIEIDTKVATKNEFADGASISEWAKEAVTTCQMAGIIEGNENGEIKPTTGFMRSQGTVVLNHVNTIFHTGK